MSFSLAALAQSNFLSALSARYRHRQQQQQQDFDGHKTYKICVLSLGERGFVPGGGWKRCKVYADGAINFRINYDLKQRGKAWKSRDFPPRDGG